MTDQHVPMGPEYGTQRPPTGQDSQSEHTDIGVSRGFARWLEANHTSLAFSSFQSSRLFLVGLMPDGTVSVHQQLFQRAMGLAWGQERLYISSLMQVWRLENQLGPGELADDRFDIQLLPRKTHITGTIDIHEMAVDSKGRLIFVATDLSCLGVLDRVHSFRPIWKPPFISEIRRGDRCHMNGLGMVDGRPKYVTCVSQTDVESGWHGRPLPKGVIVDVETDRIVTDNLSMPHSPRAGPDGRLYAVDSGRGFLVEVDPATGGLTDIAFCPGFLRGLEIVGQFAVVTVSKPRYGSFEGLPIGEEMERRGLKPMCAVMIIDLASRTIVEWLTLEGYVKELFTVVALPGIKCPSSIGPTDADFPVKITFDPTIEPLAY
jgi:uncharacterized protein (TIGR03032 family)